MVSLSFSTTTYSHHIRLLIEEMQRIDVDDEPELREMGVAGIFGPGSITDEIMAFLKGLS